MPRERELRRRVLQALRRHESELAEAIRAIVRSRIEPNRITAARDDIVRLVASVHSGHASAVEALARYGAAARGDPLYEG